jgi:N6-adenosine-specific RNA methylase IME4
MILEGIIYSFQTNPEMSKTVENRWIYKVISSLPPFASFLKSSQLNPEVNTGNIGKIKHTHKRYN